MSTDISQENHGEKGKFCDLQKKLFYWKKRANMVIFRNDYVVFEEKTKTCKKQRRNASFHGSTLTKTLIQIEKIEGRKNAVSEPQKEREQSFVHFYQKEGQKSCKANFPLLKKHTKNDKSFVLINKA